MKSVVLDRVLIIVSFFIMGLCAQAQNDFNAANTYYKAKEYDKAIESYRRLMHNDGVSSALLYNMGNAYYQKNDYAGAMLCYARGLKLDPNNKAILNNYNYLLQKISDSNVGLQQKGEDFSVEPDDVSFFEGMRNKISVETSTNFWATGACVTFILCVLCIVLYVFTRNITSRKAGFFGSGIFLITTIVLLIFSFSAAYSQTHSTTGVIKDYECSLLKEPDNDSGISAPKLRAGTIVNILEEKVDPLSKLKWFKVRLNHNYVGWINSEKLDVI